MRVGASANKGSFVAAENVNRALALQQFDLRLPHGMSAEYARFLEEIARATGESRDVVATRATNEDPRRGDSRE